MDALLAGGLIADLVVAVMLVEAMVLIAVQRRQGLAKAAQGTARLLLPGFCLVMALRSALVSADGLWIAGWLALAGVTHGLDVRARLKQVPDRP